MTDVTIRVIVVDDHAVVREGIRTVLDQAEGVTVVGEAATGEEALAAVSALRPDVVVLDITMPGLSGLEVAERVREEAPATRVLILSMHDHPEYVLGALRALYVIAQLSYSMYLFNLLVVQVVFRTLLHEIPTLTFRGLVGAGLPLCIVLAAVVSTLAYLFVEKPFMNLRQLIRPWRVEHPQLQTSEVGSSSTS